MNSDHSYILCKKLTIPAYVYFTVVLIINEVCFKIKKKTGILQKAHDLSSTRTEGRRMYGRFMQSTSSIHFKLIPFDGN